ncbi:MAG: Uma2 family endonuclease [Deltaproteobacteria bacterium]|nr:Uma2 family endonuclease [Deltaproteobacteria bacterium]
MVHKHVPGEVEYPSSDGRPMSETDDHRVEMTELVIETLEDYFEEEPTVYVSGNNFIYFTEEAPEDCVSPDAYVVRGVVKKRRDVYRVWQEGYKTPCVVFEITSKKTKREDARSKRDIYADDLKVPEYFMFDPRGDWLFEQLRGFRLGGGKYVPIVPAGGRIKSEQLGLDLVVRDRHIRFVTSSGAVLPTRKERASLERARADEERARADEERARAGEEQARAERAEVQLETERLRSDQELIRAHAQALRQAVFDLCEIFDLALDEEKRARLERMDVQALAALRLELKDKRTWPRP